MNTVRIKSNSAFREFVSWCYNNPSCVRMFYLDWSAGWDRSELAAVDILDSADAAYCALKFNVAIEDYDPAGNEFWYEGLYQGSTD